MKPPGDLGSDPSIVILGNMGYVGPVVVAHLRARFPRSRLVGVDCGYFSDQLMSADGWPEKHLDAQVIADVRDVDGEVFADADAVVALAAISNDPMGARFEAVTELVNHRAMEQCARLAAERGVSRFVFASSCSVYGRAEGPARHEGDPLAPQTAYARSKIAMEQSLAAMNDSSMTRTALRFATACGPSPRLRLDLVLNDFVASAQTSGRITVLSDGSPWRPLIDVRDMARAIEWALLRDNANGGDFLALNVGADAWNYQVRDLACAVAAAMPGTEVSINHAAAADNRSYRVDFERFRAMAPEHQPQFTLDDTIRALLAQFDDLDFSDANFRKSALMRLRALEGLVDRGVLDDDLRWTAPT